MAKPEVFNRTSWAINCNGTGGSSHGNVHNIGTGDCTIEAWVVDTGTGGTNQAYILSKQLQGGNQKGWNLNLRYYEGGTFTNVGLSFSREDTSVSPGYRTARIESVTDFSYPRHVAYRISSGTEHLFIDGVKYTPTYRSGGYGSITNVDSTNPFSIGARSPASNTVYGNVKVAEARIWNLARTDAEIAEWAHKRVQGNESGLVGYYPCDEGTGSTIGSDGSAGADGTLQGTYSWVDGPPISGNTSPILI